jgi:AmmeMemoRadiSam system protein B/AmmeMemoRadiSam system protein A
MSLLRREDRGDMGSIKGTLNFELKIVVAVIGGFLFSVALFGHPRMAGAKDQTRFVRKPVVAGYFYPADAGELSKKIDAYLKGQSTRSERLPSTLFGIVVPHAGYDYSGRVSAAAYYQITGRPYRRVILLGASHRFAFKGASIDPAGSWQTPLGNVPIDEEASATLMEKCPFIRPMPEAFAQEHSLEVQVPFLQKTLNDFTIVPIVMGTMEGKQYGILADALAAMIRKDPREILIVASSDLSHYHPYEEARELDSRTMGRILDLDTKRLLKETESGACEMCGVQPVATLMTVAEKLKGKAAKLDYANSGDVTADKKRVVGYAALAFSNPAEETGPLNSQEQRELLKMARQVLERYVQKGEISPPADKDKKLAEKRGVFVTLTKGGNLRGCIGYIKSVQPLYKAVAEMTVSAASRDPRFPPVTREELKDIRIEVSVLSPLQQVTDPGKVEVGKQGLLISRSGRSGLLLPQVATEQGWNREQFLQQTCVKAGLPPGAWKEKGTGIYAFTAQVFSE